MFCLYCGERLPLLRDLGLGDFCSAAHHEQFEQLQHEFHEADHGQAPARSSLVPLHPQIAPKDVPPATRSAKSGLSPEPALPAEAAASELIRKEPPQCAAVRVSPAIAEPGYVGIITRATYCGAASSGNSDPLLPFSEIAASGPRARYGRKLLHLSRSTSFVVLPAVARTLPPLFRTTGEPLLAPLHVRISETVAGIAENAAPPPAVPQPKHAAAAYYWHRTWRPAAIAACLAGLILLIARTSERTAHAADRNATPSGWLRVRQNIAQRAAINMVDDFRTGLDSWKGHRASSGWSYDSVGFIRPAALAVYDPSLPLTDYSFEFLGQLRSKGVGVAVRAADLNNYYAVRLAVVHAGPLPSIAIVRYPVIDGREGRHVSKPLPLTLRPDTLFHARILADGDEFTLMIQDQIVDFWTDARFRRGGIGFFCLRGDDARLRWIEITHHDDTLGRLCALIAPYSVPVTNESWEK